MKTGLSSFFKTSGVTVLLYGLLMGGVIVLGIVISRKTLDNYEWRITRALENRESAPAVAIAEQRGQKEDYDFANHRLWAKALIADRKHDKAVDLLIESLDRGERAAGRAVYSVGYNPAATYRLLENALLAKGDKVYANEIHRILIDLGSGSINETSGTVEAESKEYVNWIDLGSARLDNGCAVIENALHFDRNSTATLGLPGKGDALVLCYRGSKAAGLGSVLKLVCGDRELIRLYGNSSEERWITVPLDNADQISYNVKLSFINDLYVPISKADRNFEVLKIGVRTNR